MSTLPNDDAAVIRSALLRASRAAGRLVSALHAQGVPVRVVLAPAAVELHLPDHAVMTADERNPVWRGIVGLPITLYSSAPLESP